MSNVNVHDLRMKKWESREKYHYFLLGITLAFLTYSFSLGTINEQSHLLILTHIGWASLVLSLLYGISARHHASLARKHFYDFTRDAEFLLLKKDEQKGGDSLRPVLRGKGNGPDTTQQEIESYICSKEETIKKSSQEHEKACGLDKKHSRQQAVFLFVGLFCICAFNVINLPNPYNKLDQDFYWLVHGDQRTESENPKTGLK